VTALNQSAVTITIGTVSASTTSSPGHGPNFAIVSDTCTGAMLAPNASCTFGMTFNASALGNFTGTATVPYTGAPGSPQLVSLSGTGVKASFTATSSIAFPNTQVGTTSSTIGVETITNSSTVSLTINTIPAPTGNFALTSLDTNPCNLSGTTILTATGSAGACCTVGVTFTPTAPGVRTGSLSISSAYANSVPATVLKGNGTLAALTLSPGSLSFGIVPHGTTCADKVVTVTNPNTSVNGTVTISGISTSNAAFGIHSTTCGSTLAPSGMCTINVNFTPPTTGAFSGTLNVNDNAGSNVQKGTLYGTGS
jgi:hypothetical protein